MRRSWKGLLLTSALVAPWSGPAFAANHETVVDKSGQDNIDIVDSSESEIEREIHQLGIDTGTSDAPDEGGEDDGVPPELHLVADEITAAYAARDFGKVFELLSLTPEVRAVRPEVNLLEAWSHHNSGNPKKALELFMALYSDKPDLGNAEGVIYSGMASDYYTKTYTFAGKMGGPLAEILVPGAGLGPQDPKSSNEELHKDFLNGWLAAAIRYGRTETVIKVAGLLGHDNTDEMNAAAELGRGWRLYKSGDFGPALNAFESADVPAATAGQRREARLGQVLSLKELGRTSEALAVMSESDMASPDFAEVRSALLLSQAFQDYEAGHYDKSLSAARDLQGANHTPRSARLLEGWSLLRLKHYEEAAEIFEEAYRAKQDEESANGLVASLGAFGKQDTILALIEELGGPLSLPSEKQAEETGKDWVPSIEDRAFYRGDFALAAAGYPEVEQTLHRWTGFSAGYKYREGEEGLGLLHMYGGKLSLDLTEDRVHVRANIEFLHLSSNSAPENPSLTGSRTAGPRPFAPTYEETAIQPSFLMRKEGRWGYDASLGTTPIGGDIHPAMTGHFDFVHHNKSARYAFGVHRNSVYESVLSTVGLVDTVTGVSYGRVVETGLHASAYQPLSDSWAFTGEANWAERTGENVDTNQSRTFAVGVVYSFDAKGFTYLAAGPTFRSVAFDRNRSFFTFGHGGYYSPADVRNVSLAVNFLTEERKDWILRGSFSAGYEEADSDPAPYYPLSPLASDPVYEGSETEGLAIAGHFVAARRLGENVVGEAGIYGIDTEDYGEAGVFLKLRYVFGKRSETFRTDLTEDMFRKYH